MRFVGVKVLDRTGEGKTSNVINAIEFVIANRAKLNVQVINLSLGHPIYAPAADDPLVQAVEHTFNGDIVWCTGVRDGYLVRPTSFTETDNIVWGTGGGF